jgi:hypothetical protein
VQAAGSKMANRDEGVYIDVLFSINRRTSNSASSFYLTDSNRRPSDTIFSSLETFFEKAV